MAKKKNNTKKPVPEKTVMIKIAEKVGELAGRIVNEKEHLAAMAGGAIKSVKARIQNITARKKTGTKKAAKKAVKKLAKKIARPAAKNIKKAATVKKAAIKKTIKKTVKKAAKKATAKKS